MFQKDVRGNQGLRTRFRGLAPPDADAAIRRECNEWLVLAEASLEKSLDELQETTPSQGQIDTVEGSDAQVASHGLLEPPPLN